MADVPAQYNQIYTLAVQAGIKRDGTVFQSREYSDGEWCRFQRGMPKKIGGYREMFGSFRGIARGMISNSYDGVNYIFTGNQDGIDVFTTGTSFGIGSGPYIANIIDGYSQFAISVTGAAQFTIAGTTSLTTVFPAGTKVIFSQTSPVQYTVTTSSFGGTSTVVNLSASISGTPTSVWIDNTNFVQDPRNLWQFNININLKVAT